ncbi:MAG: hypothetical protein IJH53_07700 [Oscillospiraceae bacterium]|nr:hypothetical protein [Oscillospiraceae bacterium]
MDIDRNFLEEMLIMGEDKEPKADNIVYMTPAEETKTVELTLSELRLLDRILQEAANGRKTAVPWLSSYEAGRLNIIRRKLTVKERDRAISH